MSSKYQAPFGPGGPNAVDAATLEKLLSLALSRGGDYADLFFEYSASGSYAYDEGILKSAGRATGLGLGVRVVKGDATGYAHVEDLDLKAMEHAARTAAQIASGGGGTQALRLETRATPSRYEVKTHSVDVPGEVKRALLERADRAARAADPRVVRVDASISEEYREVLVATSDGKFARDTQPLIRFGVRVIAEENGKRQSGSSGGGGRTGLEYFDRLSPRAAREGSRGARPSACSTRARLRRARWKWSSPPATAGSCSTKPSATASRRISTARRPATTPIRLATASRASCARWWTTRASPAAAASVNVDDEGNVPECATLIENGKLVGYMHDRLSAGFFGTKVTGNGRRESFRSHPMPRMTNTILLAGNDDPADIVRSVKRGVFAKKFGGGQVDITNGDFVFSLTEGYLIEDGKITAPLKGVNLIGNGPEVMRKVVMLGNDLEISDGIWTCGKDGQSVPVGVGCPTVKISSVTVGGTQIG
jgi:TldD protein